MSSVLAASMASAAIFALRRDRSPDGARVRKAELRRRTRETSGSFSRGNELVNIGTGEDITIAEFARVVAAVIGYTGEISFDTSRPDGTPRKWLDVSRLARLGWRARTTLEDGIRLAYRAYLTESKQAAE